MRNKLSQTLTLFWLLTFFMQALSQNVEAQSSSNSDIDNRLKRLELEIKDLHIHLFSEQRPDSVSNKIIRNDKEVTSASGKQVFPKIDSVASTIVKLQNLEALVRSLQGVTEELNNRLDNLISDLDARLASLEAKNSLRENSEQTTGMLDDKKSNGSEVVVSNQVSKPGVLGYISRGDLAKKQIQSSRNPQDARNSAKQNRKALSGINLGSAKKQNRLLPEGDAKTRYQSAFGYLRKREFQKAELALKEFLTTHPDDPLVPNAMYWLGETYYTRGKYEDAAEIFISGYEQHSESSKTPDNLLKLGLSLLKLERRADACIAFAQLLLEFPNSSKSLTRRAINERKRHGCAA